MNEMDKGENVLSPKAIHCELINYFSQNAGEENLDKMDWLIKEVMTKEEHRKNLIQKYGEEKYDELLKWYTRTNIQKREERRLREEARRIRAEARLRIEELKAQAYAKQSDVAQEKVTMVKKEAEEEKKLEEPKPEPIPEPRNLELIKNLVSDDDFHAIENLPVKFEDSGQLIIVIPTGYLGRENYSKVNDVVTRMNGKYVIAGRDSRFEIPKPTPTP
jgi:23S rRNA-/tRNA-specific pseudouridylate synthase